MPYGQERSQVSRKLLISRDLAMQKREASELNTDASRRFPENSTVPLRDETHQPVLYVDGFADLLSVSMSFDTGFR